MKAIGGWAIAVAVLVWLARRADAGATWEALRHASWGPACLAAALAVSSEYLVASKKYQELAKLVAVRIPMRDVVVVRMGSYALRHLMPLRSGEVVRLAYLRRRHAVPLARGATIGLLDALTDTAGLAALAAFAWTSSALGAGGGAAAAGALVATSAAGAAGGALLPRVPPRARAALGAAGWTLTLVTIDVVTYRLALAAVGVPLAPRDALALLPVVVVLAGVPLAPLGLGARETAMSLLLGAHAAPADLLAAGLVATAVVKLAPAVAGLPLVPRLLAESLEGPPPAP